MRKEDERKGKKVGAIDKQNEPIKFEVCLQHRPGTIINYGDFDTECVTEARLEDEKRIVLLRKDGPDGTSFHVKAQSGVPNIPLDDPRVKDIPRLPMSDLSDYIKLHCDPKTLEVRAIGNWVGPGRYTKESMAHFFSSAILASLEERPWGVRAPAEAKIGILDTI